MIQKQRLIDTFLDLVKIDSPSGHEKQIAEEVAKRLKAVGAEVEFDSYGNIIAKVKGEGKPFMLNAHLDTVEPGRGVKPEIVHDIIKSDGSTVLGADPKAGVAIILETLTSLKEENINHIPLEIVFTLSEEMYLQGAINLNYEKISATEGITLDGDGDMCSIDISSPGFERIDATIIGRGAHAGVEPEKGLSAIQIAAEIICKLPLGRIDDETTTNIGMFHGGSARNSVPEIAQILGEIRSRDINKLDVLTNRFEETFSHVMSFYPEAKLKMTMERGFNPYQWDENVPLIQKIKKVLVPLCGPVSFVHSGGGTDANIFHTRGIQSVVLGTGAYNMHTIREYVEISKMLKSAQFAEAFVKSL